MNLKRIKKLPKLNKPQRLRIRKYRRALLLLWYKKTRNGMSSMLSFSKLKSINLRYKYSKRLRSKRFKKLSILLNTYAIEQAGRRHQFWLNYFQIYAKT